MIKDTVAMTKLLIDELQGTIKKQNEIIGVLTMHNNFLKDVQDQHTAWISKAKKEAGFPDIISFDIVWRNVLVVYNKEK